jgi:hypothetical protein
MKDSVARNTVRAVLAGTSGVGRLLILRDVIADLRADGVRMDLMLRELQVLPEPPPRSPAFSPAFRRGDDR